MSVIHKFPFSVDPVDDMLHIAVPLFSKVLHFDLQNGVPTVWVEIADRPADEAKQVKRFRVYGTGHELRHRSGGSYLGSAIGYDGQLVLHCYEVGES